MNIRRIFTLGVLFCILPFLGAGSSDVPEKDFSVALAQVKLTIPSDPQVRKYLGLKQDSGQFSLSQVDADILIIEIFSMYCPHCQRHAPMANKLDQEIRNRKVLKNRVKHIGIGIGNSAYEVNIFRQKYSIPYPLFEDPGGRVLNSMSGIRTPHYFALHKGSGTAIDVFFSRQGPFDDAKAFLETILKKSGIKV